MASKIHARLIYRIEFSIEITLKQISQERI